MSLRLGVCIKVRPGGADWEELRAAPFYEISPASRAALEGALRLKDALAAEVTVYALGGAEIQTQLRACLAAGAHRALHILTEGAEQADGWSTAQILLPFLREEAPSVLFCGGRTGAGEVPVYLAEELDQALVSDVTHVEVNAQTGEALLRRKRGRAQRETLLCPLPLIAALCPAAFPMRYISIFQRSRTDCGRLEIRPAAFAAPRRTCLETGDPRPRPRRINAPQASMSAAERMKFLLSGGKVRSAPARDERIFAGDPQEAAERLYAFLKERGLLPGDTDGGA